HVGPPLGDVAKNFVVVFEDGLAGMDFKVNHFGHLLDAVGEVGEVVVQLVLEFEVEVPVEVCGEALQPLLRRSFF
ncbi:hypothetical protein CO176_00005, partial [Candidatus Woesebacteria bacterium CG_4_9_14_3_um_filter_39_10]